LIFGAFPLLILEAFKAGRIFIYQLHINFYPSKENEMNRSIVVAALLALSLSACGEKAATSQVAAPVPAPAVAAPAAAVASPAAAEAATASDAMKK